MIALAAGLAFATLLFVQAPPAPATKPTANPELVDALARELGSTPQQAEGAAGALFGLAKDRLKPDDWSSVRAAVPGMDGLLKAAPTVTTGTSGGVGGALKSATALGAGSGASGLAGVAGAFQALKLKPELASKAVPVLTKYVTKSGGAEVGKLLAGALK
jgi:hypothetical protein